MENPLWSALAAVPDAEHKTVADLGCGTGPLLPYLAERFGQVIALDFAPAMLERAKKRLGQSAAGRVVFLERPIHDLGDFAGQGRCRNRHQFARDARRAVDRSQLAVHPCLSEADGQFLGIVPSIDAISYHLMLLMDQAIDQGLEPKEAEKFASLNLERRRYDFVFGEFQLSGHSPEVLAALRARISIEEGRIHDRHSAESPLPMGRQPALATTIWPTCPRSWDWFFQTRCDARPVG